MKKTIERMKFELENCVKMPIFEIPVVDIRTCTDEYIVFNVFIKGNSLIAQHESLTEKQDKSKKIAFVSLVIDDMYGLDENLSELRTICSEAILDSDWFQLADNE